MAGLWLECSVLTRFTRGPVVTGEASRTMVSSWVAMALSASGGTLSTRPGINKAVAAPAVVMAEYASVLGNKNERWVDGGREIGVCGKECSVGLESQKLVFGSGDDASPKL